MKCIRGDLDIFSILLKHYAYQVHYTHTRYMLQLTNTVLSVIAEAIVYINTETAGNPENEWMIYYTMESLLRPTL